MAFSYLGIDVNPDDLHNAKYKKFELSLDNTRVDNGYSSTLEATDGPADVEILGKNHRGGFDRSELDALVSNFENDMGNGEYSPVLFHYDNAKGTHWILIIGKNEDGSYKAIGPGSLDEKHGFDVKISDSGVVSGDGFAGSGEGRTVSHVAQYHRTD